MSNERSETEAGGGRSRLGEATALHRRLPFKVRFPCSHGQWFRHPVDTKKPKWVWCDGGETKWLSQVNELFVKEAFAGVALNVESPVMWVEVSDD